MANILIPPTTFRERLIGMDDVYNGVYEPLLMEYQVQDRVDSAELLRRTLTRVPVDQVPSAFVYQDPYATLRIVHHIHQVETPFGQPTHPMTDMYMAFSGEVFNGMAQMVQIPVDSFFAPTGDIVVPTPEALTAQLAVTPMAGPFNQLGAADTEVINTRCAVPVPFAYLGLFLFRSLTPQQAWQQVGEQVIQDGRAQDCAIFLNFLRVAAVAIRAPGRNQLNCPPATAQPNAVSPPIDGPLLEHTHRKLRQYLPALFGQQAPVGDPHLAAIVKTVAEGFEALRADRAQEREAAVADKSFSQVFPANAAGIRRLCLAGDKDDALPEFWTFLASVKGNKSQGLSAFISFVNTRSNNPDSSRVRPVVSTALYVNISAFELGASDLEVITQGVSPFLMCPTGYVKANATTVLTKKYLLLQETLPLLSDIHELVPSNDYSLPSDLHSLADFVGAYSVIWDVLVGENHPLAIALRQHYRYWHEQVRQIIKAIPEDHLISVVIIGTLRYIQLAVHRYVNEVMYAENVVVPVPSFQHIETAVDGRLFQLFPSLPSTYMKPVSAPTALRLPLPPPVTHTPTPPKGSAATIGNPVIAPITEPNQAFLETFSKNDITIAQLRLVPTQPKIRRGNGTLCLSYHLRGQCFSSCRRHSTHRKLEKVEEENMRAFIKANL